MAWAGLVPAHAGSGPPAPLFSVNAGYLNQTTLTEDHFNYSIPGGTSVADSLVVTNYSAADLRVRVYGADMHSAIGGGFAPAQAYERMTHVGAWLAVSSPTLTISARQQVADAFRMSLPAGIAPGDYLGAIVAAVDVPGSRPGLQQQARAALIVKVSVPGTVHASAQTGSLSVTDSGIGKEFAVTVRNRGNVLLALDGALEVRGADGHITARLPLEPEGIYVIPGGTTTLRAAWTGTPLAGVYSARATVRASFGQHGSRDLATAPATLYFVPLGHLGGAAILLLLIGLAWRPARRWAAEFRAEQREVRAFKQQRRAARQRR